MLAAVQKQIRCQAHRLGVSLSNPGNFKKKRQCCVDERRMLFGPKWFRVITVAMHPESYKQAIFDGKISIDGTDGTSTIKNFSPFSDETSNLQICCTKVRLTLDTKVEIPSESTSEQTMFKFYLPLLERPFDIQNALHPQQHANIWKLVTKLLVCRKLSVVMWGLIRKGSSSYFAAPFPRLTNYKAAESETPLFDDPFVALLLHCGLNQCSNCKLLEIQVPAQESACRLKPMREHGIWAYMPKTDGNGKLEVKTWSLSQSALVVIEVPDGDMSSFKKEHHAAARRSKKQRTIQRCCCVAFQTPCMSLQMWFACIFPNWTRMSTYPIFMSTHVIEMHVFSMSKFTRGPKLVQDYGQSCWSGSEGRALGGKKGETEEGFGGGRGGCPAWWFVWLGVCESFWRVTSGLKQDVCCGFALKTVLLIHDACQWPAVGHQKFCFALVSSLSCFLPVERSHLLQSDVSYHKFASALLGSV